VPHQAGARSGANWRPEAVTFLLSGLLCCAALIWVLQLWRADVRVPITYNYGPSPRGGLRQTNGNDLTFECMLAKEIVDNGWPLHNPRLGAPGEQDLRDFPLPDLVTFLSMKSLSWFGLSWGTIVNLYYFAGFLLATWSALAVLLHFGIARAPAVVAALLFAFAPYHFYRGEWHLSLSAYFVIPLAGMLVLWVMLDERLFTVVRRGRFLMFPLPSRKGAAALAACAMLGSDGAYYAFFTILLLMGAGLYRAFEGRGLRRAGVAATLAGVIVLAAVLNLLPNIVHILLDGKNPEVAARLPAEAETYALKLTLLVLPIAGHRIPQLAALRAAYNNAQPEINEATLAAALGAFSAAGFCFLLLSLIAGCPRQRHRALIRRLSLLNLSAFLIGTLGGIGSLVAWTMWSQFRAYNRIIIFIAFFSVMAVAALLDEIGQRWTHRGQYRWLYGSVLAGILLAGLFDQTSPAWVPPYQHVSEQYRNDAEFAAVVEGRLPPGAMVLQLPFVRFPEYPPPHSMGAYDHLRPYLHSVSLRWSYGAMKGRYWDAWQGDLLKRPAEEVVEAAAVAGFGALYVDRNGYADRGASIQIALRGMGLTPLESRNGRLWLYDIGPYAAGLRARLGPIEWSRAHEAVLHPLVIHWLPLCSSLEGDAGHDWRWCGSRGAFTLENPSGRVRRVQIHGSLVPATSGACTLRIDSPGWVETVPLNGNSPQQLEHGLDVPPGTSVVRLSSDCRRLQTPSDARPLVFRIDNFRAALADATPLPELTWSGGFYPLERNEGKTWHWCSSSGELTIRNPGPASETNIRMIVASRQAIPSPLSITGPGFAESITISPAGAVFSKRFLVPQGNSVIRFSSPAAPLPPPNDPRQLVFRVEDLRYGGSLLTPHLIQAN
jgi:phosphoglycerol transferase